MFSLVALKASFSLSLFFPLLCYNLTLNTFLTLSNGVFLMDNFLSFANPLSLYNFWDSLSSPSLLLHQSFSNSLCSAKPQLQIYILKQLKYLMFKKKAPSYLPSMSIRSHFLPVFPSHSIHSSPTKMMFLPGLIADT